MSDRYWLLRNERCWTVVAVLATVCEQPQTLCGGDESIPVCAPLRRPAWKWREIGSMPFGSQCACATVVVGIALGSLQESTKWRWSSSRILEYRNSVLCTLRIQTVSFILRSPAESRVVDDHDPCSKQAVPCINGNDIPPPSPRMRVTVLTSFNTSCRQLLV